MKPKLLIIVTGDPLKSSRPAEALRIAAGVGVWQKVDVSIYLQGEALRGLEELDGAPGEGDLGQYCSMLEESGRPIYAPKNANEMPGRKKSAKRFSELTDNQLAELVSGQTYVLRI